MTSVRSQTSNLDIGGPKGRGYLACGSPDGRLRDKYLTVGVYLGDESLGEGSLRQGRQPIK